MGFNSVFEGLTRCPLSLTLAGPVVTSRTTTFNIKIIFTGIRKNGDFFPYTTLINWFS